MSRANIISVETEPSSVAGIAEIGGEIDVPVIGEIGAAAVELASKTVIVTFRVHGPEQIRSYRYFGTDATEILAGADPANYEGQRVD